MCVVGGACRITHLSLKHTPIDVVWEGSDVNLDVMQRLMRATNVQQRLAAVQSGWKVIRSLAVWVRVGGGSEVRDASKERSWCARGEGTVSGDCRLTTHTRGAQIVQQLGWGGGGIRTQERRYSLARRA